jgi:hypothetical protein
VIDWLFVVRHAVWILGAAVVVAAWSFGRFSGFTPLCRKILRAGALVCCAGFALTTPLWQALLWFAAAVLIAWDLQKQ